MAFAVTRAVYDESGLGFRKVSNFMLNLRFSVL